MVRRLFGASLLACLLLPLASCNSGSDNDKPTYGFVTNVVADFWKIGEAGARQAGEDLDVNVEIKMPPSGAVEEQQRMVNDLLTMGVDGIAISPIDPANQGNLLKKISDNTILITHDSDAPDSPREVYIGVNNYDAGRMCGELVEQALPDGGEVIIFVGKLEQLNAKQRRQGVIDHLLGRDHDATRYDSPDAKLEGDKYTILGTYTDGGDQVKAKNRVQEALALHPNVQCMVGLFEYNPPKIIDVLKQADKLNEVKIVAFDENAATLQGIREGYVEGTVVQDPYMYGYKSIEVLHKLNGGDRSIIPEDGVIPVPAKLIVSDNVDQFEQELNERKGGGAAATE